MSISAFNAITQNTVKLGEVIDVDLIFPVGVDATTDLKFPMGESAAPVYAPIDLKFPVAGGVAYAPRWCS